MKAANTVLGFAIWLGVALVVTGLSRGACH